jgi:small GTP-binding protein
MAQEYLKRKVLLLGDGAVGKTSLVRRFVVDKFGDDYITTIGAKVTKKDMRVQTGMDAFDISLIMWDVLGQRGFHAVQNSSFQGARGAILVYDMTRPETAESLKTYWLPRLREVAGEIPRILFANKVDLVAERSLAEEKVGWLAAELGCGFYLTSAKTGENVEHGFGTLATDLIEARQTEISNLSELSGEIVNPDTVGVADMIMVDFCNEFGGIEAGTPVLREQFTRAGLDVKNPTTDSLVRAIDLLADVESSFKPASEVEKAKTRRLGWVNGLGKP